MSKSKLPKRDSKGFLHFSDYPNFLPNLTPEEIFKRGSFGGTYWRPITSRVTNKPIKYSNQHHEFPFLSNISENLLTRPYDQYSIDINKYKVKCGSTLEEWEKPRRTGRWIHPQDPYGWVQWYCRFYLGRRTDDDERQITRWEKFASPEKGRFTKRLINMVSNNKDSPVIRQSLQHWAYELK